MKEVWAVLLGILLIFGVSKAKADPLDDLLQGKLVEYDGVCRFDKNDMLVFENSDDMKVVRCVVGFEPPDRHDKKFVLLFDDNGPVVLLEYSKMNKAQRKLWNRGSI